MASRDRQAGSAQLLLDELLRASYPEKSSDWIADESRAGVTMLREATGRPALTVDAPVELNFVRSSVCVGEGCAEVARLPNGYVALRDGKARAKPAIFFTGAEWKSFVYGAKNGEFDFI